MKFEVWTHVSHKWKQKIHFQKKNYKELKNNFVHEKCHVMFWQLMASPKPWLFGSWWSLSPCTSSPSFDAFMLWSSSLCRSHKIRCISGVHFHCHCLPHIPSHQTFHASSTINVYNPVHIRMTLVINFFPNKCLGHLVMMFLPPCGPLDVRQCCYDLLESWRWWRCHWWLFFLLDLFLNVIIAIICGPIKMLTIDVCSKYVLTILESYSQPECWWVWS
jgi:hypothetical protein